MKKFTLRIDDELNKLLEIYVLKKKLSSKNEAIIKVLEMVLKNGDTIINYKELDRKMERILKLQSLNNNLLEQLFSNHGFSMNLNKKEDMMLKELYDDIRKQYVIFMD